MDGGNSRRVGLTVLSANWRPNRRYRREAGPGCCGWLGCGLIGTQPNADRCELDESRIVGRELVVSGRGSAPEDQAPVLSFVHAGTPPPGKRVGSIDSETSYSQPSRHASWNGSHRTG